MRNSSYTKTKLALASFVVAWREKYWEKRVFTVRLLAEVLALVVVGFWLVLLRFWAGSPTVWFLFLFVRSVVFLWL